jgi:hypothetical protein
LVRPRTDRVGQVDERVAAPSGLDELPVFAADFASVGQQKTRETREQGALASAVRPEQTENFPGSTRNVAARSASI